MSCRKDIIAMNINCVFNEGRLLREDGLQLADAVMTALIIILVIVTLVGVGYKQFMRSNINYYLRMSCVMSVDCMTS